MQNLASKILCIFVTGGAYAPYAPCLSTPLLTMSAECAPGFPMKFCTRALLSCQQPAC